MALERLVRCLLGKGTPVGKQFRACSLCLWICTSGHMQFQTNSAHLFLGVNLEMLYSGMYFHCFEGKHCKKWVDQSSIFVLNR